KTNWIVTGLAYSPSFKSDRTCFAASVGGLYRSADAGETWTLTPPAEKYLARISLSPDFATDRLAFIIGGMLHPSHDGAATFSAPIYKSRVSGLWCAPGIATTGEAWLISPWAGVAYTTDRGKTWTDSNAGLDEFRPTDLAVSPGFRQDGTLFLTTVGGG